MFSVLIKKYFGKYVLHRKGLQYKRCEYFHPVGKNFRTPHRSLVHSAGFGMERFGKLQDEQRKTEIKTHRDGAQSKILQNAIARTRNHNAYGQVHLMDKHKLQVCKTPDSRGKETTGSMPTKPPQDPLKTSPRNAQSFPSEAVVVLWPAALAGFLCIWVDSRTTTQTHKLALAALTSVASSL